MYFSHTHLSNKPHHLLLSMMACMLITQSASATTQSEQDKEEDLKRRLVPNPTVHLTPDAMVNQERVDGGVGGTSGTVSVSDADADVSNGEQVAQDLPCFDIHTIAFTTVGKHTDLDELNGALGVFGVSGKSFDELLASNGINKCMSIHDVGKVVKLAQNRLIDQGFATTRVVIGDQDLKSGTLLLTVVVGTVGQVIADTNDSKASVHHRQQPKLNSSHTLPANFTASLPVKSGDVLNIRALETALENFKRVPSADASFELAPSQSGAIGESDILIKYKQDRRLRTSLYLDDSGSEATGKYSANVSVSLDNLANTNDLLYLSYGYSFDGLDKKENSPDKQHSNSYSLGYVLPIDNAVFNVSANRYDYDQTVAGVNQDYTYSGQSQNLSAGLSYLAHRDASSKTYLNLGGFSKTQKNFVDETEIDVQRRKVSGWTAGVKHEKAIGQGKISTSLSYQRGTGAFNAITPPEKLFNEGDSRVGIIKVGFDAYYPFAIKNKAFAYDASFKGQYAKDTLVPSERMSIGGRHSVRGFDGERTLSADHGALLQQNLLMPLSSLLNKSQLANHQLYLGVDAGFVKMNQSEQDELLLGNHLIGSAIGIKGQFNRQNNPYQSLNYDIFASYPIYAPKGFFGRNADGTSKDGDWVYGFSVGVGF